MYNFVRPYIFPQVERPHQPQAETIGLRTFIGIETMCPEGFVPCDLFRHNHDKQFGDKEIVQHSGMVTVKDKASALDALKKKIVDQGEGPHPDDPDSHYNIFLNVSLGSIGHGTAMITWRIRLFSR